MSGTIFLMKRNGWLVALVALSLLAAGALLAQQDTPSVPRTPPVEPVRDEKQAYVEALRKHFKDKPNEEGPVNLYGKAVDQNGDPIPSVTIELELNYYPADYARRVDRVMDRLDPERELNSITEKLTIITDDAGRFFYGGRKGMSLSVIRIEKSGYSHWTPARMHFNYGSRLGERPGGFDGKLPPHFANYWLPSSDIFLTGWKDGEVERVIRIERQIFFSKSPELKWPVNVLQGAAPTNGAFADFVITRSGSITNRSLDNGFEYTLTVLNGGVQQTQEALAFRAPTDGYIDSIKFQTTRGEEMPGITKKFYLKLRDGKVYASLTIYCHLNGMTLTGISNAQLGRLLLPKSDYFIKDGRSHPKPDLTIRDAEEIRAFDLRTQAAR